MGSMKRIHLPKTLALLAAATIALTGCTAAAGAEGLNNQASNSSSNVAAKVLLSVTLVGDEPSSSVPMPGFLS